MDLFDQNPTREPLAARMRPRTLDEYIGQDAIVGPGRLLRRAIQADQLTSVIFYGPPGTGKTTLARVIANHTQSSFLTLNAVLTGVQQIRSAITQAEENRKLYNRRTILFVDEVHRWNKSQQDALLPWVENGVFILIGATTENPFFEVNRALVSRSRIFQLVSLTEEDLTRIARQALNDSERGYGRWNVTFEDGALKHLVETAGGDARSLLNALELAVETTPERWPPADGEDIYVSMETAEQSIQKKVVLYDRDGDYHYDVISAFIKSLRGRDPDASLYWLARMVAAGEDPRFIFRRMLISACEDTGLADPHAITVTESCAAAFDRVGLPEGRYFLAHAALYLSTAPKSNSSMAFFDALASVEKEDAEVPDHLRDDNRDAEGFGHGAGYMYPHAFRHHWAAQQYLPDQLMGRVFYTPTEEGYEGTIRSGVLTRRELQIAAILNASPQNVPPENSAVPDYQSAKTAAGGAKKKARNYTYTPSASRFDEWAARTEENRAASLLETRDFIVGAADIARHHRVLVLHADDGLLLWEAARRAPEGLTAGVCRFEQNQKILEQYMNTLDKLDRPVLAFSDTRVPSASAINALARKAGVAEKKGESLLFDRIIARDLFVFSSDFDVTLETKAAANGFKRLTAADSVIVFSQRIPAKGQRLSRLFDGLRPVQADENLRNAAAKLKEMEDAFYTDSSSPLFSWDEQTVADIMRAEGFLTELRDISAEEKRRVGEREANAWFNPETSAYGAAAARALDERIIEALKRILVEESLRSPFVWKSRSILFVCRQA